jgi:adenylate cyclase
VPTIVISTYEHVDLAVKGIEAGAEDYLVKPFNNTLLRVRVTTSLEKNTSATWTARVSKSIAPSRWPEMAWATWTASFSSASKKKMI